MVQVFVICLLCASLSLLIPLRLWQILPVRVKALICSEDVKRFMQRQRSLKSNRSRQSVSTLSVLGSGGHTTEMFCLIEKLDRNFYKPLTFVVAETDATSERVIENKKGQIGQAAVIKLPRSREVGQSWISTVHTTLFATFAAIKIVLKIKPDLVLCNGPGTCIPICFAIYLAKFFGVASTKIIFCESFARVKSLSLTGKILYYLADRFVVHWPQLHERLPYSEYIGVIC